VIESAYDKLNDVLFVRRADTKVGITREHPRYSWLVLNHAYDGQVVGVRILNPSKPAQTPWAECPARHGLPADLREEVDRFMTWMESGSKDPDQCAVRQTPPDWLLSVQA
jgi:hypothetical protein